MHIFTGPANSSITTSHFFLEFMFVFSAHCLNWVFELSISCFHYNYYQLEIRKKKLIFRYTFISPLLSLCRLIILWLLGCSTRAQPCTWKHLSGNFQELGMWPHLTDGSVAMPQLLNVLTSLQMAVLKQIIRHWNILQTASSLQYACLSIPSLITVLDNMKYFLSISSTKASN